MSEGGRKRKGGGLHSAPMKTPKTEPDETAPHPLEVKTEPGAEVPRPAKKRRLVEPKTPKVEVKEEPVDEKEAEPLIVFERFPDQPTGPEEVKLEKPSEAAEGEAGPEGTKEARRLFGRFCQLVQDPDCLFDVIKRIKDEETGGQGGGVKSEESLEVGGDEEWEDAEDEDLPPRPTELHFALIALKAGRASAADFFAAQGYRLSHAALVPQPKGELTLCAVVLTSDAEAVAAMEDSGYRKDKELRVQPAFLPRGTGCLLLVKPVTSPLLKPFRTSYARSGCRLRCAKGVWDGRGSEQSLQTRQDPKKKGQRVTLGFGIVRGKASKAQVKRFFLRNGGRFGKVTIAYIGGPKLCFKVNFSSTTAALGALRELGKAELGSGSGVLCLLDDVRYPPALQRQRPAIHPPFVPSRKAKDRWAKPRAKARRRAEAAAGTAAPLSKSARKRAAAKARTEKAAAQAQTQVKATKKNRKRKAVKAKQNAAPHHTTLQG